MITNFTAEQRQIAQKHFADWETASTSTGPADRELVERAIGLIYEILRLLPPKVLWAASLRQGRQLARHACVTSTSILVEPSWPTDFGGFPLSRSMSGNAIGEWIALRGSLARAGWRRDSLSVQAGLGEHPDVRPREVRLGLGLTPALLGKLTGRRTIHSDDPYYRSGEHIPDLVEIINKALNPSACPWWVFDDVVVIVDRPHLVSVDPDGQWHNPTGPAVCYSDGTEYYFWRGLPVPRSLIVPGWNVAAILNANNLEVRRAGIERMGWETFAEATPLQQVCAPAPDPGNPGYLLHLYDIPSRLAGQFSARLLVCTNATPERDGTRRKFGIMVPPDITTPLHAAGWTFGLTADEYAGVQRAC